MSKDNEFDQRILEILRLDSRKSFVDIGKELGLSESAIRRRIKNLIDNGTISRFTIEENSSKKTSAITLLSVSSTTDTNSVASKLQDIHGVKVIYEITGQYDVAVILSADSINEINSSIDEIRRIQGV
ncbi:MAG: Lrp/AsnC family transcriptional regulator, partial [Nitrososphaeraceae archaeon]|nr:Lrp/AsnC family transcriptional regulator [Nitrososphaeraceae archaeon]